MFEIKKKNESKIRKEKGEEKGPFNNLARNETSR